MHTMFYIRIIFQTSNLSRTKYQISFRHVVLFAQSIEAMFSVENEDVVGAAPTADAPTTS